MTNTVIIGAGPAGMSAALYLKKSNIDFILIEQNIPGGQLNQIDKINNYLGAGNISGYDLSIKMYEHILSLNIDIKNQKVVNIKTVNSKKIVTTDKEIIECKNVLLAIGKTPIKLDISNSNLKGISYCAMCDGSFYKNKTIALISSGSLAVSSINYLSKMCKKIYLITNSFPDIFKNKIQKFDNLEIVTEKLIKIEGTTKVSAIVTENKKIKIDGIFVVLGSKIDLSWLSNLKLKTTNNHIIVNENMETNIKGIYACGDVIAKSIYQVSNAVGEGALVANAIQKESGNYE